MPVRCLPAAAALLCLAVWHPAEAGEPGPGTKNVIRIEGGPDSPMTIITGDDKDVWERTDTRQVLSFQDADGQTIHVYSDHPVTRARVEGIIQSGKHAGEAADKARREADAAARSGGG